jgi:hypothetical protein
MTGVAAAVDSIGAQQVILLAALALIVLVYLITRVQRRGRDGSPKQYRREIDSATAQSETVKRDMEQLLAALEDLSQKINGQIDASLAKLRETTVDADRRISALRILIAESKRLAGGSEGGSSPADAPRPTDAAAEPQVQSGAAAASQEPRETAPPAIPSVSLPEQRHQRVYELADRGLTPVQIAQELQAQPGEVELILNLRRVES